MLCTMIKMKLITITILFAGLIIAGCKKDDPMNTDLNQGSTIDNNLISGSGTTSFIRVIGGIDLDGLYSVKQTIDGGFIFCGFSENQANSERDILLLKTDNTGGTEWIKTFSDNYTDQGWYIQETDNNEFIIAATSTTQASSSMSSTPYLGQLLKVNGNGTLQWKKSYNMGSFTSFSTVQQTSDGGYIICGSEYSSETAFLIKTDASGNELWQKSFSNKKEFNHIELTTDGGFVICGVDNSNPTKQTDIFIAKTDNTGDTLWTKTLGNNYDNTARAIKQDGNDFVIAGYNTNTASGASGFVISVDSIGDENWSKDYLSDNIQALDFIELTSDNEYILIGRESFGNNSDCYLLKVSSNNGDVLWKSTFSEGNYNLLNEVQQTNDNGYIIAGYSLKNGNGNGLIIKTDQNGN